MCANIRAVRIVGSAFLLEGRNLDTAMARGGRQAPSAPEPQFTVAEVVLRREFLFQRIQTAAIRPPIADLTMRTEFQGLGCRRP